VIESSPATTCARDHLITDHRSLSFAAPTRAILNVFFCHLFPTMSSSTIAVLTRSHGVAVKKRKAKRNELQEVVFDDEARRCVIQRFSSCVSAGQ